MPKKQKRFKSEQAILRAIDAMEEKRLAKYAEADQLELIAKDMASKPMLFNITDTQWKRTLAERARRSAQRAASKKVELGKALSAYRTILLPMPMNDDNSVVL